MQTTDEESSGLVVDAHIEREGFGLDVDLRVSSGAVLGLTGDIGSGKSSVLSLLVGGLRSVSGSVVVDGEIWDDATTFLEDRSVCLLGQRFRDDLPEELTGVEAVCAEILRIDPDEADAEQVAQSVLSGLGVGDHVVDRLPWTFSGAEAQRVALARTIAPYPRVVLLDEPFGALDMRTGAAVRAWLSEWLGDYDGMAVIASTDEAVLTELCDEIVSLD